MENKAKGADRTDKIQPAPFNCFEFSFIKTGLCIPVKADTVYKG